MGAINAKAVNRSASVVSAVEVTEVSEESSASDADPWAEPNAELSSEVAMAYGRSETIEAPLPDDVSPNDSAPDDDRPVLKIPEKIKDLQE